MATLELDLAEEAVSAPAHKGRRLGILFWAAIGCIRLDTYLAWAPILKWTTLSLLLLLRLCRHRARCRRALGPGRV